MISGRLWNKWEGRAWVIAALPCTFLLPQAVLIKLIAFMSFWALVKACGAIRAGREPDEEG